MPRRGNHEGTITKRIDGRWEARLTLANGKRKSFYGKTRAEVAQRLTKAQHDLSRGLPVVAEKLTIAAYLDTWLASMEMQVEAATWRRYADHMKRIKEGLGRVVLSRLDPQQLTSFYSDCVKKQGLAPSTVRLMATIMHHALQDALDMGLVQYNVAKHARKPPASQAEIQPFSEDEGAQFLEYLAEHQHRMEALYVLALKTGMREGELLALHWEDVHLDRKELQVRFSVKERYNKATRKKEFYLGRPKTKKSKRTIKLGDLAVSALKEHRIRQKLERLAVGDVWQDNDLVFPNQLGVCYQPPTIYMQYQKLLRLAGLPKRRFHDLRHTCATILLSRFIPVNQVSEMLGHSDIAITLRIYGHVIPVMHEAAASIMDEVFSRRA